ncbi:unnamed protein product [Orchesella dallaii]|uniref:Uncharacterized protein n=1 Tax=Orchesella dallaii TaxID=48710 RepID=A0ABP1S794_9HEXA
MGSCQSSMESSPLPKIVTNLHKVLPVFEELIEDLDYIMDDLREIVKGIDCEIDCSADVEPHLRILAITLIDLSYVLEDMGQMFTDIAAASSELKDASNSLGSTCESLGKVVTRFMEFLAEVFQTIYENNGENNCVLAVMIDSTLHQLELLLGSY